MRSAVLWPVAVLMSFAPAALLDSCADDEAVGSLSSDASGGADTRSRPGIGSYSRAYAAASELPLCDEAHDLQLVWVADQEALMACVDGIWQVIPLPGVAGEKGDPGPPGEKGDPGPPGAGPWTNDGGYVSYTAGGVGIGTSDSFNPTLAVQSQSSETNPLAAGAYTLHLENGDTTANNLTGIAYESRDTAGQIRTVGTIGFATTDHTADSANGDLVITSRHDGPLAERVRMKSNGFLGLATSDPVATLDVNGTARLARYGAAPHACGVPVQGTLAMTSTFRLCVCDGSAWVHASDGSTACAWQ